MHIKDCVSFESCVFVDIGVQECCFRIGNFSLKFDHRVMIVRLLLLFNDLFYFSLFYGPEREYVVYIAFPKERIQCALGFQSLSNSVQMNLLAKATAIVVPMVVPCV